MRQPSTQRGEIAETDGNARESTERSCSALKIVVCFWSSFRFQMCSGPGSHKECCTGQLEMSAESDGGEPSFLSSTDFDMNLWELGSHRLCQIGLRGCEHWSQHVHRCASGS